MSKVCIPKPGPPPRTKLSIYGTNTQKLDHAERISPNMKERETEIKSEKVKETFYLWH